MYRKTRKTGEPFRWDYTSTPALRRRSSILALSNANLTDDDQLEKRALTPAPAPTSEPYPYPYPYPYHSAASPPPSAEAWPTPVASGRSRLPLPLPPAQSQSQSPPSASSDAGDTASSVATANSSSAEPPHSAGSGKRPRRKYDGVYRTNEPLPGKPLIEFEDKVWDLEDEYARLDRAAASASASASTSNQRQPDLRPPPHGASEMSV